jgi:hypothetical protein
MELEALCKKLREDT